MANIFLVRHGEVAGNIGARLVFSGWDDVPLTRRGQAQSFEVAARLATEKLVSIYASDLQRAQRTAQFIAQPHGLTVQTDACWREINFGDWGGASEADLLEKWPDLWRARQLDPENVRPPNGENWRDLQARVLPAWDELVARHEGESVVLVAHQGTIRAILLSLLQAPLLAYRRLQISNCSVSRVTAVAGRVLIEAVNLTDHLSAAA